MPRQGGSDLRWARVGYWAQGRQCDSIVAFSVGYLRGDKLPQYWRAKGPADFIRKFGPGIKWASTASYHMLVFNGHPILRIWNNVNKCTILEVNDSLCALLESTFSIDEIPAGSQKARKEFRYRLYVQDITEMKFILESVKTIYGSMEWPGE